MSERSWAAVVVAAGRGTRFGRPKQLLELAGLPMLGWSLQTFAEIPGIAEFVVVTETEYLASVHALLRRLALPHAAQVVEGGPRRMDSVYNGLSAVSRASDAVLIHDGARPLVRAEHVRAGMLEVRAGRASLLAVPVIDTIKRVARETMLVGETLDRSTLWAAQTPQFALLEDVRRAHEAARRDAIEATDDAMLLERIGVDVVVTPSSSENFKVTLSQDAARAETLLRARTVTV